MEIVLDIDVDFNEEWYDIVKKVLELLQAEFPKRDVQVESVKVF